MPRRALTSCPKCGSRVSPYAAGCAVCGADLPPFAERHRRTFLDDARDRAREAMARLSRGDRQPGRR